MLLVVDDVVVRHHPSLPPVLDGVSFTAAVGEIVAVIGRNGSGKSTLARALAGLVHTERGTIRMEQRPEPRVGLVLQDPAAQAVASTVADDIAFGPEGHGVPASRIAERVERLLDALGLREVAARGPARLSGGQQQCVAIAGILACEIDVLVLDEPTSMLDAPARRAVARVVREVARSRPVVWITQDADDLAICDSVVALDHGHVAWAGPVAGFVEQQQRARDLGIDLPTAARLAHELRAAGAWPDAAPAPVTERELVLALGGGRPGGA